MLKNKTNAMRILDNNKIEYTINTYECDGGIDGISVAKKIGAKADSVYKTLVTKGKINYFVFVIPVEHELDMKKAAKSIGEKSVEMIAVKDINKVTGYIRGGCSPIGMKKPYKTVIDSSAERLDRFYVSGGRIGIQIYISPRDLSGLINAEFNDIII